LRACHHPKIPIVLQHLLGQRDKISVFETDYDTPDGTCIRDYIHVTDLAKAHILALEALLSGKKKTAIYNLGNDLGYSVKEVIETCEKVTGRKAVIEYTDHCPGDPARLVASSEKINKELGWKAEYSLDIGRRSISLICTCSISKYRYIRVGVSRYGEFNMRILC
jgi:UDP-glucose 4-epimerase